MIYEAFHVEVDIKLKPAEYKIAYPTLYLYFGTWKFWVKSAEISTIRQYIIHNGKEYQT